MQVLRDILESRQIPIYFCAVAVAVLAALFAPRTTLLESLITPALAVMLYATFLQVPLAGLKRACPNARFNPARGTCRKVA